MRKLLQLLFLIAIFAIPSYPQSATANLASSGTGCLSTGTTPNCLSLQLVSNRTTTASITLAGTFSATLQFESSGDGGQTFQAQAMNPSGGGASVTSATAPGLWTACVAALTQIRVRASGYVSGTVVATINTSTASVASCASSAGSGVTSFNSRTGAVTPGSSDYTCANLSDNTLCNFAEADGDIIAGVTGSWAKGTALPNGITATTQSPGDNSTKVATTAYANAAASAATQTIANGTSALGTTLIASGACASTVSTTATGTATTDNIMADFNADPTSTTGYSASSSGMLTIIKFPTSGHVNFDVCNNTGSGITPGAVTLNWRVVR